MSHTHVDPALGEDGDEDGMNDSVEDFISDSDRGASPEIDLFSDQGTPPLDFLPLFCEFGKTRFVSPPVVARIVAERSSATVKPIPKNYAELLQQYQLNLEFYPNSIVQQGLRPMRIFLYIINKSVAKPYKIPQEITLGIRVPATQILDEDYKEKTLVDLINTAEKLGNPKNLPFPQYVKSDDFLGAFCQDPAPDYHIAIKRNHKHSSNHYTLYIEICLKLDAFPHFINDRKYGLSLTCSKEHCLSNAYRDFIIQELYKFLATVDLEEKSHSESNFRQASELVILTELQKIIEAYSEEKILSSSCEPIPLRKRGLRTAKSTFSRRSKNLSANISAPILVPVAPISSESDLSLLAMTASDLAKTLGGAENYTLTVSKSSSTSRVFKLEICLKEGKFPRFTEDREFSVLLENVSIDILSKLSRNKCIQNLYEYFSTLTLAEGRNFKRALDLDIKRIRGIFSTLFSSSKKRSPLIAKTRKKRRRKVASVFFDSESETRTSPFSSTLSTLAKAES